MLVLFPRRLELVEQLTADLALFFNIHHSQGRIALESVESTDDECVDRLGGVSLDILFWRGRIVVRCGGRIDAVDGGCNRWDDGLGAGDGQRFGCECPSRFGCVDGRLSRGGNIAVNLGWLCLIRCT